MPTTTTGLATSFIQFSRPGASGGGATVTDADGKIKWAGHNLLLASEQFNAAQWTTFASTVTSNSATAPNGTTTADTFAADGTNNWHYLVGSASAGYPRTASFFVKKNTHDFVQILFSGDANPWANFDVATGVVGSSGTDQTASITSIGNGWYLCSVTTSSATAANVYISLVASASAARASGGTFSTSVFLWGAHLYRSDLGGMQQNPAMPAGMQSYYPTTPRNLLGWTEDFSNAAWTKDSANISANAVTAPNGLQTADAITSSATGAQVSVSSNAAFVAGAPFVLSVYAKAGTASFLQIIPSNAVLTSAYANFNLAAGTVGDKSGSGLTSAITPIGDGWYRCSIALTASASGSFQINMTNSATSSRGAVYSGPVGSVFYLWGAQLSDSASLDTYVPVYGAAVTSAAYYAPRLDFDGATLAARGLLVEETRTNFIRGSGDIAGAYWTPSNVTMVAAAAVAPDGTTTAARLYPTTTGTNRYIYNSVNVTSGVYISSVYAKAAGFSWFYLVNTPGSANGAWFNLTTGVVGTVAANHTATITAVGNGWYRCTVVGTVAATTVFSQFGVSDADNSTTATTSGTNGAFVWGAQVELGSFATSYIPTGSATATRTADVASVSTQAFPYSSTEGTLVASVVAFGTGNARMVQLDDGTETYRMQLAFEGASSMNYAVENMGTQAYFPVTRTSTAKIAAAYKANDFAVSYNGGTASTDTSGIVPSVNTLRLGRTSNGVEYLNGHIRQITYLPRRISNAELQSRTA